MTREQHQRVHEMLDDALGELLSDFLLQHPKLKRTITVGELLRWSKRQIQNPTMPPHQPYHDPK